MKQMNSETLETKLLHYFAYGTDRDDCTAAISDDKLIATVTCSMRKIGERSYRCLDILMIFVRFEFQGRGYAKQFIHLAHKLNPWQVTWVDTANHPRLVKGLPKWGFIFDGTDSYYKGTKNDEKRLAAESQGERTRRKAYSYYFEPAESRGKDSGS